MKTWIAREHLHTGDLPDVCVVTGEDADGLVSFKFNSLPDWTWILLLFGVFPFLVATMFATEVVQGDVPVRREIVTRYHRRKRQSLLAAAVGIAFLALAMALSQVWLAWTGVAALVVGVGVGVVASLGFIDGRPDRTGLWVKLSRVHPNFVVALEARGQVPAEI